MVPSEVQMLFDFLLKWALTCALVPNFAWYVRGRSVWDNYMDYCDPLRFSMLLNNGLIPCDNSFG